jgi:hypothetical protein
MSHQYSFKRLIYFTIPFVAFIVLLSAGTIYAASTFSNGGFETYQSYEGKAWRSYPESYGADWSLQVIDEDGLHFMDSDTFAQFITNVYLYPTSNYKLTGDYSQVFTSRHTFNFVLYQTVDVNAGTDYTFGGKIVSFWKGPGPEVDHTKIFKRIGIDWSGGTDYSNPNIDWTAWDSTDNDWRSPALAGTATGSTATVFIQVDNRGDDVGAVYLNSGHIDSFYFEPAPVVNINAPAQTGAGTVNITWDTDIDNPGDWSVWGYDVQFKDNVTNNWQTLQWHDQSGGDNESYSFTAEAGRSYTIRIRPWQEWGPIGDPAYPALPGIWKEQTIAVGGAVIGSVSNHMGLPFPGVVITATPATSPATSLSNGFYSLPTGAGAFSVKATDTGGFIAPPAADVIVPSGTTNGYLDITMRPVGNNQAISNGDFETDLSGWQVSGGVAVTDTDNHSGQGSMAISGAGTVSQSNVITNVFNPLLSFWYKSDTTFSAELIGATAGSNQLHSQAISALRTATIPAAADWTFASLDMGDTETITAEMGVNFSLSGPTGTVYIDEVSIAEGPLRSYLPVIFRN